MPFPPPRTILFDLDGTLTDPEEGILGCIGHALRRLGRDVPAPEALRWCVGPPLQESFARLLRTDDLSHAWEAVGLYRERYREQGLYECRVYSGVPELLAELRSGGRRLYVATSKPTVFAERVLEHFRLAEHFDGVFGCELDGTRSNKGELISHLLSESGIDPAGAVMVGDRKHDVLGAARSGVPAVGVTYGFGSVEELRIAGAAALCASPSALSGLLTNRL
ncbi:MAG: HAD family hydrolase [Armatimonadota bacterium]